MKCDWEAPAWRYRVVGPQYLNLCLLSIDVLCALPVYRVLYYGLNVLSPQFSSKHINIHGHQLDSLDIFLLADVLRTSIILHHISAWFVHWHFLWHHYSHVNPVHRIGQGSVSPHSSFSPCCSFMNIAFIIPLQW